MLEKVSVVIPVHQRDKIYENLVSQLRQLGFKGEIIVVGPHLDHSEYDSYRTLKSPLGRAIQQNTASIESKGEILWFLHADSNLELLNLKEIDRIVTSNPHQLHYFQLQFESKNLLMKLNEIGANLRSVFFQMPFGDQGFIISKKNFNLIGLLDEDTKYGEDHLLVWRARQFKIRLNLIKQIIKTSDRKYLNNGWFKTTIIHIYLTYLQALPEWIKLLTNEKKERYAVAIFVKTPPLSQVKTRLAKEIGKEKAEAFFWKSVRLTYKVATTILKKNFNTIEFFWAVSEEESLNHPAWSGFKTIWQNDGSLGDRIHHIYSTLKKEYKGVILIGADCPLLGPEHIIKSIELLKENSFVLGKSEDGGFYLFAGKTEISKDIWLQTPYSCEDTSRILIDLLGKGRFEFIETLFDIDELCDLNKFKNLEFYPEHIDKKYIEEIKLV